jgi:hypothetical protein
MRLRYRMSKNRNFAVTVVDGLPGKCIFIGDEFVVHVMNVLQFALNFSRRLSHKSGDHLLARVFALAGPILLTFRCAIVLRPMGSSDVGL